MAGETDGQGPDGGSQEQTPEVFDLEYVKALRAENAKWRKEAQDARARVSDYEKAQLTEAERLQAQAKAAQEAAEAARAELRKARAEAAIAQAAAKNGVNGALLGKLITVDFDDTGQPVGVEAAVSAVLNEYRELKPQAAITNPAGAGRSAKLTMEDVKKMSHEEVNARWDEVQAAMAAQRRS